jgi:hypothetical protein
MAAVSDLRAVAVLTGLARWGLLAGCKAGGESEKEKSGLAAPPTSTRAERPRPVDEDLEREREGGAAAAVTTAGLAATKAFVGERMRLSPVMARAVLDFDLIGYRRPGSGGPSPESAIRDDLVGTSRVVSWSAGEAEELRDEG